MALSISSGAGCTKVLAVGHLSKRRSNSPRRVLENKFIFTNLLSNGICMMPEVIKVVWLILIVIKMSMASTSGIFFYKIAGVQFLLQ